MRKSCNKFGVLACFIQIIAFIIIGTTLENGIPVAPIGIEGLVGCDLNVLLMMRNLKEIATCTVHLLTKLKRGTIMLADANCLGLWVEAPHAQ